MCHHISYFSSVNKTKKTVHSIVRSHSQKSPDQKATQKSRRSSKKAAVNKYLYCKITINKSVLQTRSLLLGQTFFLSLDTFSSKHVTYLISCLLCTLLIKKRDNILLVSSTFPYWEVEVVRNYFIMQGDISYKVELLT